MFSDSKNILQGMFRNACRFGESNLKLQREMLFNWSRMWPELMAPELDSRTPFAQLSRQWSSAVHGLAEKQREWLDKEYDLAFKSLGVSWGGNGDAPAVQDRPSEKVVEQVKQVPVTTRIEETPVLQDSEAVHLGAVRNIAHKVAVVTGAAGGIGEAVAHELAKRGALAVILVDRSERVNEVAQAINKEAGRNVAVSQIGDTTDAAFRKRVFNDAVENHGLVTICVPAAGITRDSLAVRIDKETGKAELYPVDAFRQVTEVNLIAPIYWAIEMIGRIAEDRRQRGLKRWEPEEDGAGCRCIPRLGFFTRQQGANLLCRRKGRTGRCCRDLDEGSHVPWRALWDHSSWFHRHPDGQSTGRGLPRQERVAVHATTTPDSTG